MIPGHIEGASGNLTPPEGWDKAHNGVCGELPMRYETDEHGNLMLASVWFPTPEEIAAIVGGAPVKLWVLGNRHPPVMLGTGNVPAC